jgi:hypothetical protein
MARTKKELEDIAARTEAWLDTVDPNEMTPVAPQIVRLREAVAARQAADHDIEQAVAAARNAGFSWARIALVLGISRQAAHERFAQHTPV